jgi:hypothetical protein
MAVSVLELHRRGHADDDIALALATQDAHRRAGAPYRTLAEILAGKTARPRPAAVPEDLTTRQLRRRGRLGQAALLADQAALTETDPDRAAQVRYHATGLKALARKPDQMEFDFFGGGNVSLGHQFIDAIQGRLLQTEATPAARHLALASLTMIVRHLGWQSYSCDKTAADLADLMGVKAPDMATTLALLERVGAITRTKRGRTKIITINPEGAFRGDVNRHAEAVDRYRAEIVQLRPEPAE